LLLLICYYKMLIDACLTFIKWNFIFKCEYYLTVKYTCLNVIVVFFYLDLYMCLCISLVAVSLWGWLWSLLIYLKLLGVFTESMLWSVTLGIGDLFYFRLILEIFWISVWCWCKWCDSYFDVLKNVFRCDVFNLNEVLDVWHPCLLNYLLYFY